VLTPLLLIPAADGQGLFQADAPDGSAPGHAAAQYEITIANGQLLTLGSTVRFL
jgi:hypothetical protein